MILSKAETKKLLSISIGCPDGGPGAGNAHEPKYTQAWFLVIEFGWDHARSETSAGYYTSVTVEHVPVRVVLVREADALVYWRVNRDYLSACTTAARANLSEPCINVNSDCLFNAVSNILADRGSGLSASKVEILLFVRKNLKSRVASLIPVLI